MTNISKDRAVEILKSRGYNAVLENGVVIIYYDIEDDIENIKAVDEKLPKVMQEINYIASWGYKPGKNNKNDISEKETNNTPEENEEI